MAAAPAKVRENKSGRGEENRFARIMSAHPLIVALRNWRRYDGNREIDQSVVTFSNEGEESIKCLHGGISRSIGWLFLYSQ